MTQTLFDKLWEQHRIKTLESGKDLIAIDRVFLHERTGSVALSADDSRTPGGDVFIKATRGYAKQTGINLIDVLDADQGIVHVIAPELGIAQPGLTMVCPDSHTCSLGALGALAWGIGSSDGEHAMATGTLRVNKPPQMRITVNGALKPGITAKDLALHIIGKLGASGAKRCAVEYAGPAIEALPIEARLTLCNMAVEYSAFTAIIAPDEKTISFVEGKRYAPKGEAWQQAITAWQTMHSDADAKFDYEYEIKAENVVPTVTWGTSPEHAIAITGTVPIDITEPNALGALDYMGLKAGTKLEGLDIKGAFIGSCTNARISDLRAAADILKGNKVSSSVKAICVPGSMAVRRQAESEGLDTIFKDAGFEWGAPGCALCFYAGGETFAPGTRVISSTNRNFESRQGPGVRTHLASPVVVAASAIAGHICGPDDVVKGDAHAA